MPARRRSLRRVLAAAAAAAALAAAISFLRPAPGDEAPPSPPAKAGREEILVARDFRQASSRAGGVKWRLDAQAAEHRPLEHRTTLTGLTLTFFTAEGREVLLTAPEGSIAPEAERLVARGGVVVRSGDYRLRTARLEHDRRSETVLAPEPVEVTGPSLRLTADALRVFPGEGTAEFEGRVRLRLLPGEAVDFSMENH